MAGLFSCYFLPQPLLLSVPLCPCTINMADPRTVYMGPASLSAHISPSPPNSPGPSPSESNHSQLTLYMPDSQDNIEVPNTPTSVSFKHTSQVVSPAPSTKPVLSKEAVQQDPWDYDSRNPRNWSLRAKWAMTAIVSLYTFVTYVSLPANATQTCSLFAFAVLLPAP